MVFTVKVAYNIEIENSKNLPNFFERILCQNALTFGPERDSQLHYFYLKIHIPYFY